LACKSRRLASASRPRRELGAKPQIDEWRTALAIPSQSLAAARPPLAAAGLVLELSFEGELGALGPRVRSSRSLIAGRRHRAGAQEQKAGGGGQRG